MTAHIIPHPSMPTSSPVWTCHPGAKNSPPFFASGTASEYGIGALYTMTLPSRVSLQYQPDVHRMEPPVSLPFVSILRGLI